MNVLNRKMFANRDARRKLANMGGILASSPELMQTAQMFAPGGQVGSPTAQKVKTVRHPQGFVYDVYTDGRVVSQITGVPLNPNDPTQASLIREVMSLPDITPTPRPVPELETNPILNQPLQDEPTTVKPTMDEDYTPTAAELDQELLDMGAPDKRFDVVPNAIDRIYGDMGDLDQRDAEQGSTTTTEVKRGDRRDTKTVPEDPKSIFEILGIGEVGSTTNTKRRTSEEQRKKLIEEEKEVADADDADADVETADVEEPGQRGFTPGEKDDTITALEAIATGGGTSEQKVEKIRKEVFGPDVDSKTAISKYQEQFNALLGEDRDLNEEKWHTLAMIGFAIAAGEDSNALTNIANGLLEGTKMAREDRATRQARKDKINMLALEQFFSDQRLDKELRAAETRAQIAADARSSETFLDTPEGKLYTRIYQEIFDPDASNTILPENRMAEFISRVGEENAKLFFAATGLPQKETQTDTRTLDDIPTRKDGRK